MTLCPFVDARLWRNVGTSLQYFMTKQPGTFVELRDLAAVYKPVGFKRLEKHFCRSSEGLMTDAETVLLFFFV